MRLPRPWDSPGKNTGVGCHFFLQCMKVKSESEVAQSCPTLRDPMDYSLPGSSVHGVFQAKVLESGATAFSAWDVKEDAKENSCWIIISLQMGFPCGSVIKNPPANAGDTGSIPGSGRSLRRGNGNPLQYSCLGNPMDREAWWATAHAVAKSRTQLNDWLASLPKRGVSLCPFLAYYLRMESFPRNY